MNADSEPIDQDLENEINRHVEAIKRGCVELTTEDELRKKLRKSIETDTPLRIKLGVDPTANDLHLGFTLPLSKLRAFTDLGHAGVLIIGDATAMVGDPSGRDKTRPQLTSDEINEYSASYLAQASMILDMDRIEVRRNSEWLLELDFSRMIRLASHATVAQMLVRDNFSKRHEKGDPIYLHEMIYPLLQGHDSVVVEADVELGGVDQLFNLHVGRDLQATAGQSPQVCVMGPLLVGLDGSRKMSKSYDNYIGLTESPREMYGKVMSLPDDLMREWMELLTNIPMDEIESLFEEDHHPRDLKDRLARLIVTQYHDEKSSQEASEEFKRVFSEKSLPDELPTITIENSDLENGKIWVARLVVAAGFAPSTSEARRLVKQGGVRFADEIIADDRAQLPISGGEVLKVGKRKFGRISLK